LIFDEAFNPLPVRETTIFSSLGILPSYCLIAATAAAEVGSM